jgi:RimJ/RimL family protein N-acetyltransferase
MCRLGLGPLGLRRLVWRAEVGNHASRIVALRVGFRSEGMVRRGLVHRGEFVDGWTAALLPGELLEDGADRDTCPIRRARIFGRAQPSLPFRTAGGAAGRLRPMRAEDRDASVRACRDPLSIEYTTVPDPYTERDADGFIQGYAPRVWALGVEAVFAVADADDALAGTMALRLPGDETTTHIGDVGYLIGPWARGRGYAPAALRAMCAWGFGELGLSRIEWRAYVGNDASRKVAERAGFTVEGMLRASLPHRGTYRDAWIGARLVSDEVAER